MVKLFKSISAADWYQQHKQQLKNSKHLQMVYAKFDKMWDCLNVEQKLNGIITASYKQSTKESAMLIRGVFGDVATHLFILFFNESRNCTGYQNPKSAITTQELIDYIAMRLFELENSELNVIQNQKSCDSIGTIRSICISSVDQAPYYTEKSTKYCNVFNIIMKQNTLSDGEVKLIKVCRLKDHSLVDRLMALSEYISEGFMSARFDTMRCVVKGELYD